MYHPSLLHSETRERISQSISRPVDLPESRKLQIALECAEQGMRLARAADQGDLWFRCWKRAEEVRMQIKENAGRMAVLPAATALDAVSV